MLTKRREDSDGAVGGTDEVAKDGNVGAVDPDAACVHREAEFFCLLEVNTRIIEFGQTKTLRGQNTIEACRIDRTRRTMAAPRPTSYLVELLPIAFLPGGHGVLLLCPDLLNFS